MKVSGMKDLLLEKEYSIMLKEMCTMDNGIIISAKGMEFTPIKEVPDMKDTGIMTLKRVRARKSGLKAPSMLDFMKRAKSRAGEPTIG